MNKRVQGKIVTLKKGNHVFKQAEEQKYKGVRQEERKKDKCARKI